MNSNLKYQTAYRQFRSLRTIKDMELSSFYKYSTTLETTDEIIKRFFTTVGECPQLILISGGLSVSS